jgi:hypothetical protein
MLSIIFAIICTTFGPNALEPLLPEIQTQVPQNYERRSFVPSEF